MYAPFGFYRSNDFVGMRFSRVSAGYKVGNRIQNIDYICLDRDKCDCEWERELNYPPSYVLVEQCEECEQKGA